MSIYFYIMKILSAINLYIWNMVLAYIFLKMKEFGMMKDMVYFSLKMCGHYGFFL